MDGSRSLEGLGSEREIHGTARLRQQEYGSVKDNRKFER